MRATPQMTDGWYPKKRKRKSKEPSTAEGRELRLKARPSASFSSLRAHEIVNQKQRPSGNTLLAQRYPLSGNSYLWRTGWSSIPRSLLDVGVWGLMLLTRFIHHFGQDSQSFSHRFFGNC